MNCYCKTLFFLLLFCFPEIAQAQDFKDFLGTNTRREDPTNRLDAVGFVREYHLWSLDEPVTDACDVSNFFNPTNNTPQYDWENNPAATTERSFVTFYQKLLEDDREMCITLKGSLPIFDNGDCSFDFGKPPVFDADGFVNDPMNCDIVDSPAVTSTEADAYTWYTNYISSLSSFFTGGMYQTYYGNTQSQNLFTGKTFYLENWNEQDKWWCGSPNSFTPQEYAVMSSTNYDAHEVMSAPSLEGFDDAVDENQDRKFVMGGLLDIEDLEILNETVRSIEL